MLSKGREQDAIDVLHKIAQVNGGAAPTLTVDDFREIDRAMGIVDTAHHASISTAKEVVLRVFKNLGFLRELFSRKLESFTFVLLALAYMVSFYFVSLALGRLLTIALLCRMITGLLT